MSLHQSEPLNENEGDKQDEQAEDTAIFGAEGAEQPKVKEQSREVDQGAPVEAGGLPLMVPQL